MNDLRPFVSLLFALSCALGGLAACSSDEAAPDPAPVDASADHRDDVPLAPAVDAGAAAEDAVAVHLDAGDASAPSSSP